MRKGILVMFGVLVLIVIALASFLSASAAPAASQTPQVPDASSHGIKLFRHRDATTQAQPAAVNNLTYHGGPVMAGTNNYYLIFWEPTGNVSANYNSLIQRYFVDSGNSGLYQNNTQYTDSTGKGPVSGNLAGVWVDTKAYPNKPVLDRDLQTEVNSAKSQFGWSTSVNNQFFIFLEKNTDLCTDTSHSDCASNSFCAYHGWWGQTVYAAIPYSADYNCGNTLKLPNNDVADETINNASHEQMESTSDPYGTGWIDDVNNAEEADKCSWNFGPLNADGSNEVWNGHPYIVQQEWSNAISACTQGHTTVTPTVTPTRSPTITPTATPTRLPTITPTVAPTLTPTSPAASVCKVIYTVQSQWPGGFTTSITISNTGSAAINGWTLKFAFPGSQQITQGWNASFTQSGSQVTATNLSYNGTVAAGNSVSLGFNGSWTDSNPNPTSFTLNGSTCTM